MTIEFGLLVLESVLLVATIILLIYSLHEGKHRDLLLKEVARFTKVLTRQEYFFSLMDAMFSARQEIIGCITGTPPTGDDIRMTRNIVSAIEGQTRKGVIIKYLLPKFPDRIHIGVRYAMAGAEVRFSSCLMVHSIRFSVIDDRVVVLGVPESIGEKEATKKGYAIPSEGLALLLKNYFYSCEQQTSLKVYLQEVIQHSGATLAHLARELHLEERDLQKIVDREI
jgi:hypothetical protein